MSGLVIAYPKVLRPAAKRAAEALVQRGAIAIFSAEPDQRHLVGELRWRGDEGAFFFFAFGDGERDARYFPVDAITEGPDGSVRLFTEGVECVRLEAIATCDVEDPDDYRIAWQLWHQVVPLRQLLIDRCFAALTEEVRVAAVR